MFCTIELLYDVIDKKINIYYYSIDEDEDDIMKYFDEIVNLINSNKRILVHCFAGINSNILSNKMFTYVNR